MNARHNHHAVLALAILSVIIPGSLQQTCDNTAAPFVPISIPISNVTLSDHGTVSRGINISAGTPPQSLAFTARPDFNNTYVFDELNSQCPNSTSDLLCGTQHGGNFDGYSTSTWVLTGALYTAGETGQDLSGDFYGRDTVALGPDARLDNFTLGVFRNAANPTNVLGLGTNSTLLSALITANRSSSRSWSMWDGLTGRGAEDQMDGAIVLGGFDAAKTSGGGENYTIPLHAPNGPIVDPFGTSCPTGLRLAVADIVLDFLNGTAPSIFGASHPTIQYCIDPNEPIISTPAGTAENIQSFLGAGNGRSTGIYADGLLFDSYDAFRGNMVITFPNSSVNITIPASQLLVPDIRLNANGTTVTPRPAQPVLRINPLAGASVNDLAVFGRAFLSSAYLLVNYDANALTLWQARPTTDENLVGIASCNASALLGGGPSSTNDTTDSSRSHTGAIVGGVVGGVVALAILLPALFFFLRWRQQRRKNAARAADAYQLVDKADRDAEAGELHGEHRGELAGGAVVAAAAFGDEKKGRSSAMKVAGAEEPDGREELAGDERAGELSAVGQGRRVERAELGPGHVTHELE